MKNLRLPNTVSRRYQQITKALGGNLSRFDPRGPFAATCPTRELLNQLADKWAVLVLLTIQEGPIRFNALKREIEGVSQKVLVQTLRRLERNGLLTRTVAATVPVTVTYAITPLGGSLAQVVDALRDWSMNNFAEVVRARQRHDDLALPI